MIAASLTVRVIGPAVSWLCAIGMIPARLTRPTVGLRPTSPQIEAGLTIEPSVSVPTEMAHRFAVIAAAEPELEPLVLRSRAYGLSVCPPRALHPEVDRAPRKFAHSDRLVLARITHPVARRRSTTK